jgi:Peptidase family M20/M25/M40
VDQRSAHELFATAGRLICVSCDEQSATNQRSVLMPVSLAPTLSAVVELLSALVSIDSVNPDLVADGAGQAEMAKFRFRWLGDRGCEVVQGTHRPAGSRQRRGHRSRQRGGRALMLNAHMGTVGVAAMECPHDPRVVDGRLYGRGALDTKGGLAAFMLAAASVADAGLRTFSSQGRTPQRTSSHLRCAMSFAMSPAIRTQRSATGGLAHGLSVGA